MPIKPLIQAADKGLLPDAVIRAGIRLLNRKRLISEKKGDPGRKKARRIREMRQSPIAIATRDANVQHYELPPAFFTNVLGPRLKYSGCYWPDGVISLEAAERAMLGLTCERADLRDGMDILELGCGWGAITLWMAAHYPKARILAVSNSANQRRFIESACRRNAISNVQIVTADMNHFRPDRRFDRVVSVEMFEHMRNWPELLKRIAEWTNPGGAFFLHVFTHRRFLYFYETLSNDDWMGTHFFTGGLMPSDDLIHHFQDHWRVEHHWRVNGRHYEKTANAWLENLDRRRETVMPIMASTYGAAHAKLWFQRWRIFMMACAELWGFSGGREWLVSHYRLQKK